MEVSKFSRLTIGELIGQSGERPCFRGGQASGLSTRPVVNVRPGSENWLCSPLPLETWKDLKALVLCRGRSPHRGDSSVKWINVHNGELTSAGVLSWCTVSIVCYIILASGVFPVEIRRKGDRGSAQC